MLYLIKSDKLSSRNSISDLLQFFHLLNIAYHKFLTEKYTIEHTRRIAFIRDRMWFFNEKQYYANENKPFRQHDKEVQQMLILNQFKLERGLFQYEESSLKPNTIRLYEIPTDLHMMYAFEIVNKDDTLARFLSLHDCIQPTPHNQVFYQTSISIDLKGMPDEPFYQSEYEPSHLERLKYLAKLIIIRRFNNASYQQMMTLTEQIQDLSFPKLNELFQKINKIMNFQLKEDNINAFFSEKSNAKKRKLKLKHPMDV